MAYRKEDDSFRRNFIDWHLGNLVYVDHFGKNDIEETSIRHKDGRMCRYHMRYTTGWGSFGDRRPKLQTLVIDKVAIQKDILEGKLRSIDIADGDREEIQHELDLVRNRWGCGGESAELTQSRGR